MNEKSLELVHRIVEGIDDKLGEDIMVLELTQISSICDYFVIASASSQRQVKAISDEVEDRLAKHGVHSLHKEGYQTAGWILLDYGDIVVHLFSDEDRAFYKIERIWKDAPVINIDNIVKNNI